MIQIATKKKTAAQRSLVQSASGSSGSSASSGSPGSSGSSALPANSRFAFIQSCWHDDIVNQGRDAYLSEMKRQGVPSKAIDLMEVPGAFELPLLAKRLAESGQYAAIVACGFVVNGGIYRHEFVAEAVVSGLMSVQLETDVPVLSVVLTPLNFHDHEDHQRFFAEHFVVKGMQAAQACVQTVAALVQADLLMAARRATQTKQTSQTKQTKAGRADALGKSGSTPT